jgi:hypothetical protein
MANVTLSAPAGTNVVQLGAGVSATVAADGTVSVPSAYVPQLLAAGFNVITQNSDELFLQAPAAGTDLTSIVAATIPVSGTAYTIAAQPDVPRKLNVRCVQSGAVASLVLNLVGVDARGNTVSESVNVAGASTATFVTANAYATVTSATPVGTVTNVTTLGVGVGAALALLLSPGFIDLTVYKEAVSTGTATFADEAVGTVDKVAGTVAPTTAANGTKSFKFWYTWNTVDI